MPRGKVKEKVLKLSDFTEFGMPDPIYRAKFIEGGIEIDWGMLGDLHEQYRVFFYTNNKDTNLLLFSLKGNKKGQVQGFEIEAASGKAPYYIHCDSFFRVAKFPIEKYKNKYYRVSNIKLDGVSLFKIDLSIEVTEAGWEASIVKGPIRKSRKGIKLGPRKKPEIEAVQEKPQEKPAYRKLDLGDQRPAVPQFSKAMGEKVLKSFTE